MLSFFIWAVIFNCRWSITNPSCTMNIGAFLSYRSLVRRASIVSCNRACSTSIGRLLNFIVKIIIFFDFWNFLFYHLIVFFFKSYEFKTSLRWCATNVIEWIYIFGGYSLALEHWITTNSARGSHLTIICWGRCILKVVLLIIYSSISCIIIKGLIIAQF